MNRKIIFGKWESSCIVITLIGTKAVLNLPRLNNAAAGTAGWILQLYTGTITLVLFAIIAKLYRPFNGKDIIDVSEMAGGKLLRFITGFLIEAFFILSISSELRIFSEEMITMAFDDTPISFIMLLFMIGVITAAYLGIEAIVRFQAIFVPISIAAFTIFLIALLPHYDIYNIFPIFGTGLKDIFLKGAARVSEYSELLILFLIVPYIRKFDDFKKTGWVSIIITTLVMSSLTASYTLATGYINSLTSFLPAYRLGRIIDYGRYLEKAEALLVITWSTMALMYLSAGFYFLVFSYSKVFKLNYYRPLIIPFAIIIFTLALFPGSLVKSIDFFLTYFRNYSFMVTFGYIIIILIIARLRNNSNKCEND